MIDVFIAYSHFDLSYKEELKKFLRPMLREERISLWDDFDIEAGQDWDAKIKERLYDADLVLLLVSADSLASDYFYSKEVKVSLERHARGETVVVPVILRHCDWTATPLGNLEVLPEKGRPVADWPTRDQAFLDVVSRLRRVVEALEIKRKNATAEAGALRQFRAALEAADHLYGQRNWCEAALAYASALDAYHPGFVPDHALLQARQADCEAQILAEQKAEEQRIKAMEMARVAEERWDRDAQVAENRRTQAAEDQHQQKEKEQLLQEQRERRAAAPSTGRSSQRLWVGIGVGGLLVAILLLWHPWSRQSDVGRLRQENTQSQENPKTTVPTQTRTEPNPSGTQRPATNTTDKKRIDELLMDGEAFIKMHEERRARITFEEVLRLDPNNAIARSKLNSLK